MDCTYEEVHLAPGNSAVALSRLLPVLVVHGERAQLLADARDLSGRLERCSEQSPSDSLRLALSLMHHIVELIETTMDRNVAR